jgi:hypothetical protein
MGRPGTRMIRVEAGISYYNASAVKQYELNARTTLTSEPRALLMN